MSNLQTDKIKEKCLLSEEQIAMYEMKDHLQVCNNSEEIQ